MGKKANYQPIGKVPKKIQIPGEIIVGDKIFYQIVNRYHGECGHHHLKVKDARVCYEKRKNIAIMKKEPTGFWVAACDEDGNRRNLNGEEYCEFSSVGKEQDGREHTG